MKKLLVLVALVAGGLFVAGCTDTSETEKKIDAAAEQAKESAAAMEKVGEDIKKETEEATAGLKEAGEQLKSGLEEAAEKLKKEGEEATEKAKEDAAKGAEAAADALKEATDKKPE